MTQTIASSTFAEFYQTIKQHAQAVRRDRRLTVPPADTVTVHSPSCGSRLTLDAEIRDQPLQKLGYRVRACSLGQATTAIVAARAEGLDAATVHTIHVQLQSILAGETRHCDWPELEIFALASEFPARHGSALLPFQALEQLFERAAHGADDAVDAARGVPGNLQE